MELNELRQEIDSVDNEISALFRKRMLLSGRVAEFKKKTGGAVYSPSREREILYRVSGAIGPEFEDYTKIFYNTIFDLSRSYQETKLLDGENALVAKIREAKKDTAFPSRARIACQGVEGAYSQMAACKLFSLPEISYCQRFEGVFQAVSSGDCRYGVLPIENSSAGSVIEVYDLMNKYNFYIVRALRLKIDHVLLAKPGTEMSDITEVVSHEQAISQCSEFLKNNPQIKVTVFANTAAAAEYVSKSDRRDVAAISSQSCAGLYNLSIIARGFQNSDHNYTRFICISKEMEIYPGADKITFIASVEHKPGSLYSLISQFASRGLNISKIESRPIPGRDFEFRFYFDVEAPIDEKETLSVLAQLDNGGNFVFLGSYSEKS